MKDKLKTYATFIAIALLLIGIRVLPGTSSSFQPNWNTDQLLTRQTHAFEIVSATQTNSAVTFGSGIYSKTITIVNDDGTNEIYVDLNDTTATTANYPIYAGEDKTFEFVATGIGIICASGETATVRVDWTY